MRGSGLFHETRDSIGKAPESAGARRKAMAARIGPRDLTARGQIPPSGLLPHSPDLRTYGNLVIAGSHYGNSMLGFRLRNLEVS